MMSGGLVVGLVEKIVMCHFQPPARTVATASFQCPGRLLHSFGLRRPLSGRLAAGKMQDGRCLWKGTESRKA